MIRILTDSTAAIDAATAKEINVDIVPLKLLFGDDCYRDGVDISSDDFYHRLANSKKLPTTSQPTPGDFLPYFEATKQAGDSLITILLSGSLSGTVQSAVMAKEMVGYDEIHIIDSLSAITGLRLLVGQAQAMRAAGCSAREIVDAIESMKNRVALWGIVDTLEYFYKGGRLSRAGLVAGTLLKVKPILTLKGSLSVIGKARGTAKGIEFIMEQIEKQPPAKDSPILVGYTKTDEKCRQLMDTAKDRFGIVADSVSPISGVIGTHVGPDAGVITYLTD